MKYWFFLVALFFMNCSWGQDPFDKTQRTHSQFGNGADRNTFLRCT